MPRSAVRSGNRLLLLGIQFMTAMHWRLLKKKIYISLQIRVQIRLTLTTFVVTWLKL